MRMLFSSSFEPDVVLCRNTEAVLFACLSSGWDTTTGRLLDPKVRNSIKCPKDTARRYRIGSRTKVSQSFDYQLR